MINPVPPKSNPPLKSSRIPKNYSANFDDEKPEKPVAIAPVTSFGDNRSNDEGFETPKKRNLLVPIAKRQINDTIDDMDLVSIMASRLSKLETQLKLLKSELQKKDAIISSQNEEVVFLKSLQRSNSIDQILKDRNKELSEKIKSMEEFLNKYSMMWDNKLSTDSKDDFRINAQFTVDFETLKIKIEELNNRTETCIVSQDKDKAHRITENQVQHLKLYENGFIFDDSPFRPFYTSLNVSIRNNQMFIRDILDGYFPYELKDKYPQGCIIQLLDHCKEFVVTNPNAFYGPGKTMDNDSSEESGSENIQESENSSIEGDTKFISIPPPSRLKNGTESTKEFLSKLSSQYIKNGTIINLQEEISELIPYKKVDVLEVRVARLKKFV